MTYEGAKTTEKQPWSFWRIEGPGFIWNFRVLPHVHTYREHQDCQGVKVFVWRVVGGG